MKNHTINKVWINSKILLLTPCFFAVTTSFLSSSSHPTRASIVSRCLSVASLSPFPHIFDSESNHTTVSHPKRTSLFIIHSHPTQSNNSNNKKEANNERTPRKTTLNKPILIENKTTMMEKQPPSPTLEMTTSCSPSSTTQKKKTNSTNPTTTTTTTTTTTETTKKDVIIPNTKSAFPMKLFQLLEDAEIDGYEDVVSWLPQGHAFIVHKPAEFTTHVMKGWFRQTKFLSFTRQLYLYGFVKVRFGTDRGAFYHPNFKRSDKESSFSIERRSHQHPNKQQHPRSTNNSKGKSMSTTTSTTTYSHSPSSYDPSSGTSASMMQQALQHALSDIPLQFQPDTTTLRMNNHNPNEIIIPAGIGSSTGIPLFSSSFNNSNRLATLSTTDVTTTNTTPSTTTGGLLLPSTILQQPDPILLASFPSSSSPSFLPSFPYLPQVPTSSSTNTSSPIFTSYDDVDDDDRFWMIGQQPTTDNPTTDNHPSQPSSSASLWIATTTATTTTSSNNNNDASYMEQHHSDPYHHDHDHDHHHHHSRLQHLLEPTSIEDMMMTTTTTTTSNNNNDSFPLDDVLHPSQLIIQPTSATTSTNEWT